MRKVPMALQDPVVPEHDDSTHQQRLVSALEVEPHEASQSVLLYLDDPHNEKTFVFALSPSAAAQLSCLLDKAVEQYLYGEEKGET